MYGQKEKPKINYPTLKTKKKPTVAEEQKFGKKDKGPCPQKTVIDYPDLPRKQYKFHAVDFIPKKRHEDDIMHELEKEKRKPLVSYGKRGVDRNAMIEQLQEIHGFGDKKVMDKALAMEQENRELAKMGPITVDNKSRLRNKYASQNAKNAMKHYEEKFGMNPAQFLLN